MKFRTEYTPEKAPFILSPDYPVVLTGSCFADNMASRMRKSLWNATNPLGTLYNPLSIEKALRTLLLSENGPRIFNESLFYDGIKTRSWLFDSKMSAFDPADCQRAFLETSATLHSLLKDAEALFVTLGTSICYFFAEHPDYIVANCHKQPSGMFVRRFLPPEETTRIWTALARELHKRYPHLRIIFTVSPVRHLKDGFTANARSKAALMIAVDNICRVLDYCHYFPAYEILTDDLRDYRFYAADLVHPSEEAIDYIWEILRATYVDAAGEAILKEGERLLKGWSHRPLPDASRLPATAIADMEKKRRDEIRLRHAAFKAIHPAMLPLP